MGDFCWVRSDYVAGELNTPLIFSSSVVVYFLQFLHNFITQISSFLLDVMTIDKVLTENGAFKHKVSSTLNGSSEYGGKVCFFETTT